MNTSVAKPLKLQWWITRALALLAVLMMLMLSAQPFLSQELVEHRTWRQVLEAVSDTYLEQRALGADASLPNRGVIGAWHVERGESGSEVPSELAGLPAGHHTDGDTYHALVTPTGSGRLIVAIDITALETQQNRDAMLSVIFAVILVVLFLGLILWLHVNLVRPVRDIAQRLRSMDPEIAGVRLPTTYRQQEILFIAQATNQHLERVEQFIAREKSLLDQASHEFRTPIAVIAGAVDVLRTQALPASAQPVLSRIGSTAGYLSEIMAALLYLAKEEQPDCEKWPVLALHALLPELARDHEHLFRRKQVELKFGDLAPTYIRAPETMLRIAAGNIIRNAAEQTLAGSVEISLRDGLISVSDSGPGLDVADVVRRYRESLRAGAPTQGQGLGLFLISRICGRTGWRLAIDAMPGGGTMVRLDVAVSMADQPPGN